MGNIFGLKTEELGRIGCVLWIFIIFTAFQFLGYQRRVTKWLRNVACMGVNVILNRIFIGEREGKCPFRRPLYERIILKLSLWNCTIMELHNHDSGVY